MQVVKHLMRTEQHIRQYGRMTPILLKDGMGDAHEHEKALLAARDFV